MAKPTPAAPSPAPVEPEVLKPSDAYMEPQGMPPLETITPAQAAAQRTALPDVTVPTGAAGTAPTPAGGRLPLMDRRGRAFDPLLHECTLDGKPVKALEGLTPDQLGRLTPTMTSDGLHVRGRVAPLKPPGTYLPPDPSTPPPPAPDTPPPSADTPPPPAPGADGGTVPPPPGPGPAPAGSASAQEQLMAARTLAACNLMILRAAFGQPVGQLGEEQGALIESWGGVLAHYGMAKMHPLVGLAVINGGLVMAAMKHEETQTAIQRLSLWVKVKAGSLWLWLTRRKPAPAPAP